MDPSADEDRPVARADLATMLRRTTVVLVLCTLAYFLLPQWGSWSAESGGGRTSAALELTGSLLAFVALVVVLVRAVRRGGRGLPPAYARVQWLLTSLYLLVLGFALLYRLVAQVSPGSFVGLSSRVDALYFSVTVISTVGFGDVHAVGPLARGLVTAHMLLNLIYIGTAIRLLGSTSPAPGGRH